MKRLTKSQKHKNIFGVCGGISEYMGIEVSLVRILFVLGFFATGSLLLWIYILLAIILPSE
jgi:phage shock protein PspC (stress-responsive transcriptional regulator)